MGATPGPGAGRIRLLMLANDVSLRNLIPAELAKGFGFFQSKPATAFAGGGDAGRAGRSLADGQASTCRCARPGTAARSASRDAGVDMTFHFGSSSPTCARRATCAPAASSARAP
jgi:fumarylacetoacetate (FAA) hydrolase